jgi:hypothetical protein
MRVTRVIAVLGISAISYAALHGQQEMQPRPGPGSGITQVQGSVSISNTPDVRVSNVADVRVLQLPSVQIATPPFVRKGGRYAITWTTGEIDNVTIVDSGQDGWVQVETTRSRWINLRAARAIEESR